MTTSKIDVSERIRGETMAYFVKIRVSSTAADPARTHDIDEVNRAVQDVF